MQEQQPTRRIPVAVLGALSAAVLATGGGAWWVWNSAQSPTPPANTTQPSPSFNGGQTVTENAVQVYWVNTRGENIEVVPSSIALQDTNRQPKVVLENAFNRLLAGSTDPNLTTTIPQGTQLRSLEIRDNGVHIDLSQAFTTGGGSASMMGRLGQVIYTASSLNPDTPVWINVEGEPLEVLGGEGLLVDQPMTRKDFQENFEL